MEDLFLAYRKAKRGKQNTVNTMEFATNEVLNIVNLAETIYYRTYRPSRGIAFIIHRPVIREIFAAPFRDRIVHHYIYEKTTKYWESKFIDASYSCIKGRGTGLAVENTYKQMEEISENFQRDDIYYVKLDIQGYFMSLNRKALLETTLRGLDDQYKDNPCDEYRVLRFLWRQVVMDDPVEGAKFRFYPRGWDKLPRSKSLLGQPEGVGIVIGNLTSQELSNIYLNDLDWYISETLGYKYYGRYVDDFVFFVEKKDLAQARKDIGRIENFLRGRGLVLHPRKRQVQPIVRGLRFLGTKIYPGDIYPGERVYKNALRAARLYHGRRLPGDSVVSYLGHIKHYNCERLQNEMIDIICGGANKKCAGGRK